MIDNQHPIPSLQNKKGRTPSRLVLIVILLLLAGIISLRWLLSGYHAADNDSQTPKQLNLPVIVLFLIPVICGIFYVKNILGRARSLNKEKTSISALVALEQDRIGFPALALGPLDRLGGYLENHHKLLFIPWSNIRHWSIPNPIWTLLSYNAASAPSSDLYIIKLREPLPGTKTKSLYILRRAIISQEPVILAAARANGVEVTDIDGKTKLTEKFGQIRWICNVIIIVILLIIVIQTYVRLP